MALLVERTGLRTRARGLPRPHRTQLDEDWTLVFSGVAVLVIMVGLAVLTAWTAHQRDAAVQDATAAAHRLDIGGLDDRLYQDLVATQQDEVTLFQDRIDVGRASIGHDPRTDLDRVESDLTALSAQFGGSPRVQRDLTLISREMSRYTGLEAAAQADNQQGLPVGAAYLREASGYLTSYTLGSADDIRKFDQAQVRGDDAAAAGLPWPLLAAALPVLACLVGAQIVTTRCTRRLLNPGLVGATILTLVILAWSITALSIGLHAVGSDTAPHATEASALAQARVDGIQAHNDDLLTLVDHGEDCAPLTAIDDVQCTFETQVLRSLTAPRGQLRADLASAASQAPDPQVRTQISSAAKSAAGWLAAEQQLPTLQNLASKARQEPPGSYPRYNSSFVRTLIPYGSPDPQRNGAEVNVYAAHFQQAVRSAIEHEWRSYDAQAGSAEGTLNGLVTGALLLGVLAAAAGAGGIGWRVSEYWSAGRRTA